MPDANLRTAVRSALSIANGDALTQTDMEDLTSFTARNSQISNITGLEHATNLTSLDLRDNSIVTISALSGLTKLETLKLKGNDIVTISALSGLTSLTLLNLKDNDIVTISALSGLTNLEHLRLDGNSITDVQPLTSLVDLEKLWIARNSLTNAHLLSSLTNLTTIDITIPDPPDTTNPDVDISVPSGTQNSAFDVTITFTEVVSDFLQADLSLGGTATASITAWDTTDNTVFTATITPTTSGTVTLDIAANVATDAANNNNTAATPKTVTVTIAEPVVTPPQGTDTLAPDVGISVPMVPQNGAFDAIIAFTEVVSDFVQADLSLGGTATASITAWGSTDNTVFTATITPTTSGTVTLDIAADVATDAAFNGNTAASTQTVTVNLDAPSVTLSLLPEVENNRIDVEITFSEPVEGFESTDVSVTTSGLTQLDSHTIGVGSGQTVDPPPIVSITGWTPNLDKKTYTVYITTYTKTDGQVIINVPANVTTDVAGNPNTAAIQLSVNETPGMYLFVNPGQENPNSGVCHLTRVSDIDDYRENLDVNEDGSIDADDVTLVRNALGQSGDGIVNSRTDINCDDIVDEDDIALVDDTENPTVTISAPTGTQSDVFTVKFIFSEVVSYFDTTDVSLADSTATATVSQYWSQINSTTGTGFSQWTFKITPMTSEDLVISVPAGVVEDALGNLNTASTKHTVAVDWSLPRVTTLIATTPTDGSGVFTIIITFSEVVSGFEQADLSISGAGASITAWETSDNTTFTATVTPTTSGTVYYSVPAGVATDADGNSNIASAPYNSRKIDLDPPTVTVSVPTDTQSDAFDITISFSETVFDFEQADVSLAGTADATITDWEMVTPFDYWLAGKGRIEALSVYEATITPTTSGVVVITIPADVCTDWQGNNNTASDTHSITVNLAGGGAPSAILSGIMNLLDTTPLESLDLEQLEEQLQILRAQSDGSAEYLQAIALLENTLAAMRPDKTQLLANYPNPLNPETWIPYHLANPS